MRIAMFTETYPPYINGVATHVSVLTDGLKKLGHDVMVFTADPKVQRDTLRDGVLRSPAAVLKKIYGYGLPSPYSVSRMRAVREFNPDVIHIHTEFGMGLFGVRAARKLKKPMVYTMHTMYDEYVWYLIPKKLLHLGQQLMRAYIWNFARWANALTGPSYKVQEYFKELGVRTPVHVVHNSAELDQFSPKNISEKNKAAFREKYHIPQEDMICCFCGRLGKEKSCDVLLDYWAEAIRPEDHIRLVIIGDGPVREELQRQAKRLGLGNQVIFTGKVEHKDMPPYYASCDVYVTASLSDTNSISMLEGMATGLPVLQRLDPLIAEQVVNGVNGYVFNSAEELRDYLLRIKRLPPEELQALKASVIRSVQASGSQELAKNLLAVYRSVQGRPCYKHKFR